MRERKTYISLLSVVACFCVVFMHTNQLAWTFSYEKSWVARLYIDGICHFAVPVFFMISGANLLDYRERYDTKAFFKKRILKVFVPFLFWSLLAMIFCSFSMDYSHRSIGSLLWGIFEAEYVQAYWFFMPLFALYLTMPLFSSVAEKKEVFGYLIAMFFVWNTWLPQFISRQGWNYNYNMSMPVLGGCVIYLLLGYYFDHYELAWPFRVMIYIAGLVGLWYLTVQTKNVSYFIGSQFMGYKTYTGLADIAYASSVFVAFRSLEARRNKKVLEHQVQEVQVLKSQVLEREKTQEQKCLMKTETDDTKELLVGSRSKEEKKRAVQETVILGIELVTSTTFGIYLMHCGILKVLEKFIAVSDLFWGVRLLVAILVFVISAFAVWVMKKIPVVKYIVP